MKLTEVTEAERDKTYRKVIIALTPILSPYKFHIEKDSLSTAKVIAGDVGISVWKPLATNQVVVDIVNRSSIHGAKAFKALSERVAKHLLQDFQTVEHKSEDVYTIVVKVPE